MRSNVQFLHKFTGIVLSVLVVHVVCPIRNCLNRGVPVHDINRDFDDLVLIKIMQAVNWL